MAGGAVAVEATRERAPKGMRVGICGGWIWFGFGS